MRGAHCTVCSALQNDTASRKQNRRTPETKIIQIHTKKGKHHTLIYSDKEVAEILNVDPERVQTWCNQGQLKGIKVLNRFCVTERHLEQFLGMVDGAFTGNENISADGIPLGELAEAQLPDETGPSLGLSEHAQAA
jgi:hypothetical protein